MKTILFSITLSFLTITSSMAKFNKTYIIWRNYIEKPVAINEQKSYFSSVINTINNYDHRIHLTFKSATALLIMLSALDAKENSCYEQTVIFGLTSITVFLSLLKDNSIASTNLSTTLQGVMQTLLCGITASILYKDLPKIYCEESISKFLSLSLLLPSSICLALLPLSTLPSYFY